MAFSRAIACATVLLALAACDREPPKPKVGTGAAAARVNGAEVPHRPDAYALERAIDQEVIVQQAVAEGLDREPAIADKLEAARRQVLAQAWFDRLAQSGKPVTDDDVAAFRASHPHLLPGMSNEEAAPLIRKYLARQQRGQLAQAEVQKLRSAARIEYLNPPAVAGLF
jgi:hypothetical protein